MAKKIKITRKQIKQPDEFLTWTEQAWEWAEENVWQVAGILIGVIALLLLIQGGRAWLKNRDDSPRLALKDAMSTARERVVAEGAYTPGISRGFRSEQQKYETTAMMFDNIIKKHPETVEAQLAVIYAARSYEKLEQYDKSIDYYNKFYKSEIAGVLPDLKDSAIFGMARSYYSQKNYDKALEYLNQIIDSDSAFRSDAMVIAARCYYIKEQKEKADELLDKMKQEFPEAWLSQPADFLAKYWDQRDEILEEGQKLREQREAEARKEAEKAAAEAGNIELAPLE